jgi:general stress protein 26
MTTDIRETFWKAFEKSPFIMMRLAGSNEHAEPMTAQLDKEAHHAVWFFLHAGNRIAAGGKAMGQVATKGHEVFACIEGTLTPETDRARREKQWDNSVEAWFPNGLDDPQVLMLRFDITDGEVWASDWGLKAGFKMLTGMKVEPHEVGEHAVGAV